jgi:hypothetical protein
MAKPKAKTKKDRKNPKPIPRNKIKFSPVGDGPAFHMPVPTKEQVKEILARRYKKV